MFFSYPQNLIDRITAYYKKRGVEITPEQAEEYLNSMADLYESFIEFTKKWIPEKTQLIFWYTKAVS